MNSININNVSPSPADTKEGRGLFLVIVLGVAAIGLSGTFPWLPAKPIPVSTSEPTGTMPLAAPGPSPTIPLSAPTSTPPISEVAARPAVIPVNIQTLVTVTAQIADPAVIPTSVNLLRLNPSGNPTVLGRMHDDGLNGDETAGDGIYTLQTSFVESAPGSIQLQVSAAFRGLLRRVLSDTITLRSWSWQRLESQDLGLSFHFPDVGLPIRVVPSHGDGLDVEVWDEETRSFLPLVGFFTFKNSNGSDLESWFRGKIDPTGVLLSSHAYELTQTLQGIPAIVDAGPIPSEYLNRFGAVGYNGFVMSRDRQRVVGIAQAQDFQFPLFGFSPKETQELLQLILKSIEF